MSPLWHYVSEKGGTGDQLMTIGLVGRAWAALQFRKHGFWSLALLWAHLRVLSRS